MYLISFNPLRITQVSVLSKKLDNNFFYGFRVERRYRISFVLNDKFYIFNHSENLEFVEMRHDH